MPPAPSVGVATTAGLIAAIGQFAGALALILHGDNSDVAITALVTATVTLVTVMAGRYAQATKAA